MGGMYSVADRYIGEKPRHGSIESEHSASGRGLPGSKDQFISFHWDFSRT